MNNRKIFFISKNILILSWLFFVFPMVVNAQEKLIGLNNKRYSLENKNVVARLDAHGFLKLPIMDDFSYNDVFPADSIWADKNVFINNDFSFLPPTCGVATFDALNKHGHIYTNASSSPFDADYLTSRPIRLDSIFGTNSHKITPQDSVYLSFYYQPQGLGNAPDINDSLVLEFLVLPPDTMYIAADTSVLNGDTTIVIADTIIVDRWRTMWASEGMTLEAFQAKYQTSFKQVFVPIMDPVFLVKGFKFRFRNYASVANNFEPSWASNVDQWNLDYVYLDNHRNPNNNSLEDIAFIEKLPSLLKNFTSMPWKHFKVSPTSEMKSSFSVTYSNLGSIPKNVSRRIRIIDLLNGGGNYVSIGTNNLNIDGYSSINFEPNIPYTFNSTTVDSAKFLIQCTVNTSVDLNRTNDTIKYIQLFKDYYAYDDGNAEFGYGLTPANAKMAYKFKLRKKDTLSAIDIYFNNTRNNANQKYFTLMVWKSIYPEVVLYKKTALKPVFDDSLNQFHRYYISDSLLLVSDTIYIGIKQTSIENMNVGFDINNDASKNIFYNVDGAWYPTMYKGALMMHPVFGNSTYVAPRIMESNKIIPYPNPLHNNELFFHVPNDLLLNNDLQNIELRIYNNIGSLIYKSPYQPMLNVGFLTDGFYLLTVFDLKQGSCYTHKLIISK